MRRLIERKTRKGEVQESEKKFSILQETIIMKEEIAIRARIANKKRLHFRLYYVSNVRSDKKFERSKQSPVT